MLDDAHRGEFSVLVIWAVDRLCRQGIEELLRLIRELRIGSSNPPGWGGMPMARRSAARKLRYPKIGRQVMQLECSDGSVAHSVGLQSTRVVVLAAVEGREILGAVTTSVAVEDNGDAGLIAIVGGSVSDVSAGSAFRLVHRWTVRFSCAGDR